MQQDGTAWPIGRISTHQTRGLTIVEFHGEVDIAAADSIQSDLDAATKHPCQTVVIDLTPARFFGCYGLRLLCRAEQRVTEYGGRLLLVCPHPLTLRILRAGGLIGRFTPLATLSEALTLADSQAAR